MRPRAVFRFLALAVSLPVVAGWTGCASGGGGWDQPHESPQEPPKENPYLGVLEDMNAAWEEAYGMSPGELMGPFWIEPAGPPKDEPVVLGPYFKEMETEETLATYQSLIFRLSMSGLNDDNPPGFLTGSLLLGLGIEEEPGPVLLMLGLYYAEGRDAWGRSIPDGMGTIAEFGLEFGLRGYLLTKIPGEGPYCNMGWKLGAMDWSYTPTDQNDGSYGLGPYAGKGRIATGTFYMGLGWSVVRVGPAWLGLNANVGYRGLDIKNEGQIERDLFSSNQMMFQLDVEASFPF